MIEILELEKLQDRIMTNEEKEEYEKNLTNSDSSSNEDNKHKEDEEEDKEDEEEDKEDYDDKDHILNKIYKTKSGSEYKQAINSAENCEIEKIIFLTLNDYIKNRLNEEYFCKECNDDLVMKNLNIGSLFDRILNNQSIGGYWLGADSLGINIRRVNLKLDNNNILAEYDFRS